MPNIYSCWKQITVVDTVFNLLAICILHGYLPSDMIFNVYIVI